MSSPSKPLDVEAVRSQFPLLKREIAGRPLVYFDNAATSPKPQPVIDAVIDYMARYSANIHRGKHTLSEEASDAYENSRSKVARFFNADRAEIAFVRGATEAIHLVAGGLKLRPDENVVGTILEHHSNILPWSSRCEFRAAPLGPDGLPDLEQAERLIDAKTRLLTVTHTSNVTGAVVPVRAWVDLARAHGLLILIDAAQAASHSDIDAQALGADFLVVSGHKLFAPTGIGVLIGRREALEELQPTPLGGGAVSLVRGDFSFEPRDLPWRLEAGTPHIAGAIGMGAAVDFLTEIGMGPIEQRNAELSRLLYERIGTLEGLTPLGSSAGVARAPILSLVEPTGTLTPDYLSRLLSDSYGVMTRGGHHCAHPYHEQAGVNGSLRLSLHFYNTEEEVEHTARALEQLLAMVVPRGP